MKRSFKTWFWSITAVFVLLALAGATYAWFTSNRAVSTSQATARSGEENLELQIRVVQLSEAKKPHRLLKSIKPTQGISCRFQQAICGILFIRHLRQMIWHPYFKM
jgi:predicted ribosomally synthesized peptide with SipW-like signal peptide